MAGSQVPSVVKDNSSGFTGSATKISCESTGEGLLDYWGYHLALWEVFLILLSFYVFFHIVSYLALSRLYRQRR